MKRQHLRVYCRDNIEGGGKVRKDNIGGCWDNIEGGERCERTTLEGVGITLEGVGIILKEEETSEKTTLGSVL